MKLEKTRRRKVGSEVGKEGPCKQGVVKARSWLLLPVSRGAAGGFKAAKGCPSDLLESFWLQVEQTVEASGSRETSEQTPDQGGHDEE